MVTLKRNNWKHVWCKCRLQIFSCNSLLVTTDSTATYFCELRWFWCTSEKYFRKESLINHFLHFGIGNPPCDWTPVSLFELVATEQLSKWSNPRLGTKQPTRTSPAQQGQLPYPVALFCSPPFMDLSVYSWVLLALVKPVSSLFIMQRNNGESGDHVAAVMIFPKENKNYVSLTTLAIASSRAANLTPIPLTPKTVLVALGKCKARFPGNILPPQNTSGGEADRRAASMLLDATYPRDTRGATLPLWSCPCGSSAHRRLCTLMFIHDP